MVAGVVRKSVNADTLVAAIPPHIFQMCTGSNGIDLSGWLIVYAFAPYNDFAGFTRLMRGVSGLFIMDLSTNFHWPFFARNVSDFWNR